MKELNKAQEVVNSFWSKKNKPESYWISEERISYNIKWISRVLNAPRCLIDAGTGDGTLLARIIEIFPVKKCIIVDINPINIMNAKDKLLAINPEMEVQAECGDILDLNVGAIDLFLALGLFHYALEDFSIVDILNHIQAKQLLVRVPCTMKPDDELIVKYSQELGSEYAAKYRTVDNMKKLLSEFYTIKSCERIFPDHIESKYGTKQFAFNCYRKL